MIRLSNALKDLNRKGYKFSSLKRVSGGINSALFQVQSCDAVNYALKLYPLPSVHDPRNRCLTETNFLSYLRSCDVRNTSFLLDCDVSAGWSLFGWLEGHKPNSLQPADLQEIASFVSSINHSSTILARSQLQPASDAYLSLSGLITSISERIKRLLLINSRSEVSTHALQWILNVVQPRFQSICADLLDVQVNSAHWQGIESSRIASPSDVGIHNTLKTPQGLLFLDFEYAGLDDLGKLAADWILQPEYCMNKVQEDFFINCLLNQTCGLTDDSWVHRFAEIRPLIHIKWCLILLNQLQNSSLRKAQLSKAMSYFANLYPE